MRHRKKKATLDRPAGPRRALIRNLAVSFILFEHITTTLAKAKAARSFIERLITQARQGTLAKRRRLQAALAHQRAVQKLMEVLGPRFKNRAGGYTRLIKIGTRAGDRGETARLELV